MVEGFAVHLMWIPPGIYHPFSRWDLIDVPWIVRIILIPTSTSHPCRSSCKPHLGGSKLYIYIYIYRSTSTLVPSHHTCSNSTRHLNWLPPVPVISTLKKNMAYSYPLEIWPTHQFLSSLPARAKEISKASTLTRLGHSRFKPEKSSVIRWPAITSWGW